MVGLAIETFFFFLFIIRYDEINILYNHENGEDKKKTVGVSLYVTDQATRVKKKI